MRTDTPIESPGSATLRDVAILVPLPKKRLCMGELYKEKLRKVRNKEKGKRTTSFFYTTNASSDIWSGKRTQGTREQLKQRKRIGLREKKK